MAQDSRDSALLDPRSMLFLDRPATGAVVEIDASPLYEVLLGLLEFQYARKGWHLYAREWFDAMRAKASAGIEQALDELGPGCWVWHSLLFLAWQLRAGKQAHQTGQFIEHLRSMDPEQLFEFIVGGDRRSESIDSGLVRQAILGDRKAQRRLAKALFLEEPSEEASFRRFLGVPPQRIKDLLLRTIGGWYVELVQGDERKLAIRLANEARTKRIIGNSAPTRLVRASAVGIHYLPRKAVTHVVLVPSVVCRPSIVTIRFASTRMFFYPVSDEVDEADTLPGQLVKIHRALADLERLRILRSLIGSEGSVEGLSRELGRPPDAIRMQLIVLRDAGLVTLRMDERRSSFVLRENLPSVVFRTLQAFLPGTTGAAARRSNS
ncbi:MAG TPA: winged helix-turn-helix domain-containing protein [Candidatus Dormibacteraeota bacterium]|nr:winged helix-turn-helix domain-containing protein [Candidatus Dormibacteraeota bacterium]